MHFSSLAIPVIATALLVTTSWPAAAATLPATCQPLTAPADVPSITITDASMRADAAVFRIFRAGPSQPEVSVAYVTVDNTAISGRDYEGSSGTLTLDTGVTETELAIPLIDARTENVFLVSLTATSNDAFVSRRCGLALTTSESA